MGALQVSGVCRIGADPELRFTPSGAAVCSIRAIFQDRYQDRQTGEWKDGDAVWVSLVGWRQLGENMAESFKKGDDAMVTGTLVTREYETRDGGKGYAVEVKVREIGPSIRFKAAMSQRVDRQQYDGPAAGPVVDPWTGEPARQQPQGGRPQQSSTWQVSGQPVQGQGDPWGQPPSQGGPGYADRPPF
jgi:single-strand DNA-binding protein